MGVIGDTLSLRTPLRLAHGTGQAPVEMPRLKVPPIPEPSFRPLRRSLELHAQVDCEEN